MKEKVTFTSRDAYAGGAEGAVAPSALIHERAGGARIALSTEIFPSLLSSERAFSGIVDSLVCKICLGASPQIP